MGGSLRETPGGSKGWISEGKTGLGGKQVDSLRECQPALFVVPPLDWASIFIKVGIPSEASVPPSALGLTEAHRPDPRSLGKAGPIRPCSGLGGWDTGFGPGSLWVLGSLQGGELSTG